MDAPSKYPYSESTVVPNGRLPAKSVLLGSLGALLHVTFHSRCTRINLCCGLWSCDWPYTLEDDEAAPDVNLICGS